MDCVPLHFYVAGIMARAWLTNGQQAASAMRNLKVRQTYSKARQNLMTAAPLIVAAV
jgi:hypothetical protein